MTEPIVLWTNDTADLRTTFSHGSVACSLRGQDLTEDGWVTTQHVVLGRAATAKLIPLLTEFVASRPNQVHNGIEWCVRDGAVLLNGVTSCRLYCGDDAKYLVSRLLTANRTMTLFSGIPELSDVEAELWIATRIDTIAEASEF